jgi:hypothetical protein
MNELILTRKDLKPERYYTEIRHIDVLCFKLFIENTFLIAKANSIIFIDDNLSYKILKSRGMFVGKIFVWVDILCLQCNKVFNSFNENNIACCPRCNCASILLKKTINHFWTKWYIK